MSEPTTAMTVDDQVDILGQQQSLQIYTQICSCFSVPDDSSHSAIIGTLRNGLERLSASFPWLAGQIVREASCEANSGIFKIKPLEKIPRMVVKDLRQDPSVPTMDALRQANFPMSMLDENIIAPRNTIPGSCGEPVPDSNPVFLLQANLITGGLILTFVGQHSAMDMMGQGHLIHLFSKACHNEEFTSEELSCGNLARSDLIPLLDETYTPGSELTNQIARPSSFPSVSRDDDSTVLPSAPKCTWTYFTFDSASLTALKALATKSSTLTSGYISTDDALSAFIWQSVIRARILRLDHTAESTFARAVDVRRYLGISHMYPGLVQNMTHHKYPLQRLINEPLGSVASRLRLAVDPKTSTLYFSTRALATFLSRAPDTSIISFTGTLDLSVDIMLSSWAKLNCYELDFNLGLGKPEAVRRPQFTSFESLFYLMPRALDGEIAVAMCLRDEDMVRLRADETFVKYARYIG